MNFIPKNEMGVIVRFSQEIAQVTNVSFVSVRTEFPDAVLTVNNLEVRVEFEYRSSNFVAHNHDPRECDLIICWIDDIWHKNKLPTWEISKNEWLSLEIPDVSLHQKEALYWECRARKSERQTERSSLDFTTLKPKILAELNQDNPNMSQLASQLGIGRSTLYRHLGTLTGTGEIIKNGNGYELGSK